MQGLWGEKRAGKGMKQGNRDVISRNSIFGWIAAGTAGVLLVPLVAMQVTPAVRWDETDFITMGLLIFGMGSLFVLAARRVARRRRVLVAVTFLAAFLYVWAELAVGIFTNLGS